MSQVRCVVTGLLTGWCLLSVERPASAQFGPAPVSVSPVQQREIVTGQTYVGTVTPLKRSVVGSAVDGRVEVFAINQGDPVRRDDPLAQLRTTTVELELAAARAELDLARHELEELENGLRPEEIEQAKARMLAAQARAEYHRSRRRRIDDLFARDAVNEDERQLVVSEFTAAEQDAVDTQAAWKLAVAGPRAERLAQARAKVAMQQAIVEGLEDRLGKHTIRAPFDGFVVAEHTEIGQWIRQGDLVAEIVALHEVDVLVHVQEAHIAHVRKGEPARVEVSALPGRIFEGTVNSIVQQADLRSRTFPVRIRVTNLIQGDDPLIKSGMLARVTLPTGPRQESLLVPKDALVLSPRGTSVFVVTGDPQQPDATRAAPVPVEVGVAAGPLVEVRGALKPGDRVVVEGNERLRPPSQDVVVQKVLAPGAEPSARATR